MIVAGYAAAALAASICGHAVLASGFGGLRPVSDMVGPLHISIPLLALIAGVFAAIPGGAAIVLAEIAPLRSATYFAIAGAVAGAIALFMLGGVTVTLGSIAAALSDSPPPRGGGIALSGMLAVVGAGVVCGLVYWLVAGRGSGDWRVSAPEP